MGKLLLYVFLFGNNDLSKFQVFTIFKDRIKQFKIKIFWCCRFEINMQSVMQIINSHILLVITKLIHS